MHGNRNSNITLLRHVYDGLGNLARAIAPITNENSLMKMGRGDQEISDEVARKIEEKLSLPRNGMDRDNDAPIKMSALEYQIYKKISLMTEEKKCSLDMLLP